VSDRPTSDWALYRQAWTYIRPWWPMYAVALVSAPLSAALTVAQPALLKAAIDQGLVLRDVAAVQRIALYYLAAVIAGFGLQVVYSGVLGRAALLTITSLRRAIYHHTLRLPQSFFDVHPTGQLLTRATSDVEALDETLTAGAVTIVLDALLIVGILIAMFVFEPRLTLILLLMAPVVAFLVDRIRRILRVLYVELRETLAAGNAYLAERLHGITVVHLYSDEARSNAEYTRRIHAYRDAAVRSNVWDALIFAIVDGLGSVAVGLVLWVGSGALGAEPLSPGLVVAFVDYVGKLFQPMQELSAKLSILQRAASALEKIFGLLAEPTGAVDGPSPMPARPGAIRVRGLTFGYRGAPPVLSDVDLDLGRGEVVAVVGRTGSGKTTLTRLLTRAYDGYTGSIEIDGVEITALPVAGVREAIGVVHQDVQLFPGDVRFNLTLGRAMSDDALTDAIAAAQATEAVQHLGGLDGRVAHQGSNLSVGEAQLLSFARTIAHDPPIVILDEATASVDSLTEARIQAATARLLADKTVLVVAHRLSTVQHADRIVVLDAGRVVEVGRHDELLARGGAYAALVASGLGVHDGG
jgi:ATP-binding cassette subfamily B multidrug efflux pump